MSEICKKLKLIYFDKFRVPYNQSVLIFFIFYAVQKCKNVPFLHHKTPTHTYNLEFNTVPSSSVLPTSAGGQTSSTFRNLPL